MIRLANSRTCSLLLALCLALPASGELQIAGDLALTLRFLDKNTNLNANFRGDDPFNSVRARLFVRNWVTDDIGIFTEFLFDADADPRLNGAYVVFNDVVEDRLDLKVGMIPSPFGNFGLRSTYFNLNPVIGVPLVWQYKSSMVRRPDFDTVGQPLDANQLLLDRRDDLARRGSTPVAYDACWDTGIELSGRTGRIEYTAAITTASLSNPTRAADNDGFQTIGKLGFNNGKGLRAGLSGAFGAYLEPNTDGSQPASFDLESFHQKTAGLYVEYLAGKTEVFAEWIHTEWDVPALREGRLSAHSGYADIKWNVRPDIYVGIRADYMSFSEIVDSRGGGSMLTTWDIPIQRIEPALGWRFRREGLVKLVYQSTWYDGNVREDVDLLALQLHMVF